MADESMGAAALVLFAFQGDAHHQCIGGSYKTADSATDRVQWPRTVPPPPLASAGSTAHRWLLFFTIVGKTLDFYILEIANPLQFY